MTIIKKVLNCNAEDDKIIDTLNHECNRVFLKEYKRMPTMMEQRAFVVGSYNVITQIAEYLKKEV